MSEPTSVARPSISAVLVAMELDRVVASAVFRRSPRHQRLLRHLVTLALAGETTRLKESLLAVEIFHLDPARFDPSRESIVRVEARRLRQKLARYYEGVGGRDRLRIWLDAGTYVPRLEICEPAGPAPASLAVLPFLNLTGDQDAETRCDALTEELIDALVQLPGLKVVARTSVFHYKGRHDDIRDIARALGVATLLEGSVQRQGDAYRVVAQLIHGDDGLHLWSHAFETDASDLQDLVPRLARAVARGLNLDGHALARLRNGARAMADDPAARAAFYRGKYLLGRHSVDAYGSAVAAFTEAVARAPEFALAWAAKAQAHAAVAAMSACPPAAEIDAAHAAVSRALELDPELGSAHATAATLASTYARDWARAERASLEAIRYAPGSAYVHHAYGWMLVFNGRFADAEAAFAIARDLDPLDPQLQGHQLLLRFYRREFAAAATGFAEVLAREPGNLVARVLQATALLCDADTDAAQRLFAGIAADLPGDSIGPLGVVQALALAGNEVGARAAFRAMNDRFGARAVGPYRMAIAHARLGDGDDALAWLERAAAARDANFICTAVDPSFDRLRDDPRWPALLARFGFPVIDPRSTLS